MRLDFHNIDFQPKPTCLLSMFPVWRGGQASRSLPYDISFSSGFAWATEYTATAAVFQNELQLQRHTPLDGNQPGGVSSA
jgi:hypothetical protein